MDRKIAAVIVTYNPDVSHVNETVASLKKQGVSVIIVDNHSDNIEDIRAIKNIRLYESPVNKGIAYALNIGMKKAEAVGAEWVLSLDQDSAVSDTLIDIYSKFTELPDVGALCPHIVRKGKRNEAALQQAEYTEVNICPTAGFFLKTTVWRSVKGYDNWMFIDYVDYDMCMRLKRKALRIYQIRDAVVIQELGKIKYNDLFYNIGKKLNSSKIMNFSVTYNHSPLRNYYFVRNSLYYINKYNDILDVSFERKKLIKWETKKILLEKNKLKTISSVIKGFNDYRRKRIKGTKV